jgi:hypothetical protein
MHVVTITSGIFEKHDRVVTGEGENNLTTCFNKTCELNKDHEADDKPHLLFLVLLLFSCLHAAGARQSHP